MLTYLIPKKIEEISLITNVIERELRTDWKTTLKKVAEIGYISIDFGNILGIQPGEVKKYLNEMVSNRSLPEV